MTIIASMTLLLTFTLAVGCNSKSGDSAKTLVQPEVLPEDDQPNKDDISPEIKKEYSENYFKPIYVSNAGTAWSGIQNDESNGCDFSSGDYDNPICKSIIDSTNSVAARKCEKIGGHLPSKEDYEELISNFPHTYVTHWGVSSISLTTLGVSDMEDVGFHIQQKKFWTRTLKESSDRNLSVYVFGSFYDGWSGALSEQSRVDFYYNRLFTNPFYCVRYKHE